MTIAETSVTERSPITVRPLGPALADDFLEFFDHQRGPAFADNPGWAKCYCQFYHTPKAVDWPARTGEDNRAAMAGRIAAAEMEGFLAYAGGSDAEGGEVVGWLNAQPANKLIHCLDRMSLLPAPGELPDFKLARIVCFVVHPQWRRRGVARKLLDAACASLARRGIAMIEAYPFKAGASEAPADHYHGSLPLFIEVGFGIVREELTMTVVRKALTPP